MKPEKILEIIAQAKENGMINLALDALETAARDEIRFASAKAAGRSEIKKGLEAVCRSAARNGIRPELVRCTYDEEGRQIVTDAYRIYRINEPVSLSTDYESINDPFHPGIRLSETIFSHKYENDVELSVPAIGELKANIADEKAKHKKGCIVYRFGENLPAVNAEYLLEALKVFGTDAHISTKYGKYNMVYIESEIGDCGICAVKVDETTNV